MWLFEHLDHMATFSPPVPPGKNPKAIDEHITYIINKYFTEEQASFFNKNDGTNRKHVKTVSEQNLAQIQSFDF